MSLAALLLLAPALAGAQPGGGNDRGGKVRSAPRKPTKRPKKAKPFSVVELFTSENCLRCRQAGETARKLELEALTSGERIFLLSYHVDYLQGGGWRDAYADSRFSERQRQYSEALNLRRLVPGQFFFNAQNAVSTPKYEAILAYARDGLRQPVRAAIELEASAHNRASPGADVPDSLRIEFKIRGLRNLRREFLNLHIAVVESGVVSKVTAGRNKDYTFLHTNLVRQFQTERLVRTFSGKIDVPLPQNLQSARSSIIAIVQDPESGRILAADRVFVGDYLS